MTSIPIEQMVSDNKAGNYDTKEGKVEEKQNWEEEDWYRQNQITEEIDGLDHQKVKG